MIHDAIKYRWASSLGSRYALPLYFSRLADAVSHKRQSDKYLTGLPGYDSMQVEELINGEWVKLDE